MEENYVPFQDQYFHKSFAIEHELVECCSSKYKPGKEIINYINHAWGNDGKYTDFREVEANLQKCD